MERQRGLCALCGKPFVAEDPATFDHILPISRGGSNAEKNLQAAHWSCNNARGNMLIATWRALHEYSSHKYGIRDPEKIEVSVSAENTIAKMGARIAFLERANAKLHADWSEMRDQIAAIQRIVGCPENKGAVVEKLREKLAKAMKQLN